jgi:hypothetical protein
MVLFINPPSGVLFVYILGSLTLFIGICLAWAWGVITMKAALAARPDAETQARLASLQQAAGAEAQTTGGSASLIAQRMIFDGWMLDARVTVIMYCMLCLFIYLMVVSSPSFIEPSANFSSLVFEQLTPRLHSLRSSVSSSQTSSSAMDQSSPLSAAHSRCPSSNPPLQASESASHALCSSSRAQPPTSSSKASKT